MIRIIAGGFIGVVCAAIVIGALVARFPGVWVSPQFDDALAGLIGMVCSLAGMGTANCNQGDISCN